MNPSRTLLVVDDDDELREALTDVLCFEGFSVRSAKDGKEAIQTLRSGGKTQWLVLLDLMMPVMDGKEFLDARALDPFLAQVPVIVLTAGGDCRKVRAAHDIAQCLHKPVLVPDLLLAIAKFPRREDASRALPAARA